MTDSNSQPFIQTQKDLYEQILFSNKLYYAGEKILLGINRFTSGLNGIEVKKTGNKTAKRKICVLAQKNDLETFGFPKQTISNKIKDLVDRNVIIEDEITIEINNKPINVYCYAINLDYDSWVVDSSKDEAKFDKTLSINLSLTSTQVNTIQGKLKLKYLQRQLTIKSPIDYYYQTICKSFEQDFPLCETLFGIIDNTGQMNYLLGNGNLVKRDWISSIAEKYSDALVILAILILDTLVLFDLKVITDETIKTALIEIMNDAERFLTELFKYWLNNIAPKDSIEKFRKDFPESLQRLFSICTNSNQTESGFISLHDTPMYSNHTINEAKLGLEQEDEDHYTGYD